MANNEKPGIIETYGLPAILMVVLGVIGLVLYFVNKDEKTEDAKTMRTAGIGIAITGLFIGLATIGYNIYKTKQTEKLPTNSGGIEGEDALPAGV